MPDFWELEHTHNRCPPAPLGHLRTGKLMRVLPPLLYTLAILNLYVKVQQPHTALLHWLTSSGFTLGLQLGLQSPRLRQAFKVLTPQQVLQTLRTQLQARPRPAEPQGGGCGCRAAGESCLRCLVSMHVANTAWCSTHMTFR